jgi:hypothetical protein
MPQGIISYDQYSVADVTDKPHLWQGEDPVRPELSTDFRVSVGRKVFALVDNNNFYAAFLCLARTTDVPHNTDSLSRLSHKNGAIAVPYTVWSYQAGAGKEIVSRVVSMAKADSSIERVVTLSPITRMAKRFHIKNNAKEYRENPTSINFEY